jgi:hypothetical protein
MERRREKRYQIRNLGQLIDVGNGNSCIVTVVEISATGARVDLPAEAPLFSDHVKLHNASDGSTKPARVAWREGDLLGLDFRNLKGD